jgi:hypothetical protein
MKGYWENLRPSEKRLVAIVGIVVFVLINLWFVVPHFSDWGKVQERYDKAQKTLGLFESTIAQKPVWEAKVRALEGEGANVPPEDQSTHFAGTISSQAGQAGVMILSNSKSQSSTNQVGFLELSQTIQVQAKEQELVNFLYNLGSSNSLIRVRELTLSPDPPKQQLIATIKLVGSYQKKPTPRTATSGASTSTTVKPPATKPATTPASTPATTPKPTTPTTKPGVPSGVPQKSTTPSTTTSNAPARPATPITRPMLPGGRQFGTNRPGTFKSKSS